MVKQAAELLGGIDILVNNAGVCVYGDAEMATREDYQSVMGVNFYGALNCMMEAIPHMRQRRAGLIVNVSSLAAIHGVPYLAAYSASKAALVALSESIRAELASTGIRVMNVYPGYTDTEIFAAERKLGGARRPEGPYTSPVKVARAVFRAIEAGRNELILSPQGKAMAILRGAVPNLVVRAMDRIALVLREEEKVSHA
jgi:short-subunit dehydrogenase